MVNGGFNLLARPADLGLQRGDTAVQFLDRPGVEILARERGQRIVRTLREKFIQIHGAQR